MTDALPPNTESIKLSPRSPKLQTGWVVFKRCWWWFRQKQIGAFFTEDEAKDCVVQDQLDNSFCLCEYELREIELR